MNDKDLNNVHGTPVLDWNDVCLRYSCLYVSMREKGRRGERERERERERGSEREKGRKGEGVIKVMKVWENTVYMYFQTDKKFTISTYNVLQLLHVHTHLIRLGNLSTEHTLFLSTITSIISLGSYCDI